MKPMPAFVLLYAFVLLSLASGLVGCQNRAASKIVGRWDLLPPEKIDSIANGKIDDSSKADDASKMNDVTKAAADNTEDLFDSMAGDETNGTMSLVFHRDGTLETFTDFPMASTGKPKVGRWSLSSWDEGQQTAILKCELLESQTETRVLFIDRDTIQLVPPNIAVLETELRFRRNQ